MVTPLTSWTTPVVHFLFYRETSRDIFTSMQSTGGPPLTRKSVTRFPLPRFLAYVHVSGGISVGRGPQYSPTNTNFMQHSFFPSPKMRVRRGPSVKIRYTTRWKISYKFSSTLLKLWLFMFSKPIQWKKCTALPT